MIGVWLGLLAAAGLRFAIRGVRAELRRRHDARHQLRESTVTLYDDTGVELMSTTIAREFCSSTSCSCSRPKWSPPPLAIVRAR